MNLAEQTAQKGLVFSPQQQYAFERLFNSAESTYVPNGQSFWHRSSGYRFMISCDTRGCALPDDYRAADATLAVDHTAWTGDREGSTMLALRAGRQNVSYTSDRHIERSAMNYILEKILQLNLSALTDAEDVLESVRLFDGAEFVETRDIQKTYDPNSHDPEAEKDAIHLSLTRGISLAAGRRKVASRLALGRSVQIGTRHFDYWQSLYSNFVDPTVMEPQTKCYSFDSTFSAPCLGSEYRGENPNNLGWELPARQMTPYSAIPDSLHAFEDRLRAHPANQLVGNLTVCDAVRLIAHPLDESLRLRLDY